MGIKDERGRGVGKTFISSRSRFVLVVVFLLNAFDVISQCVSIFNRFEKKVESCL